jgi:hypothetical protein
VQKPRRYSSSDENMPNDLKEFSVLDNGFNTESTWIHRGSIQRDKLLKLLKHDKPHGIRHLGLCSKRILGRSGRNDPKSDITP